MIDDQIVQKARCPWGESTSIFLAMAQNQTDCCIEWPYSRMPRGYGRIMWEGRVELTHRLAFLLHNGTLPTIGEVCHSCDNPPCFNWRHLFNGTRLANVADCIAKGRFKYPSRARLTAQQVIEIRTTFVRRPRGVRGLGYHFFAKKYGVSAGAIQAIVAGRSWGDL